MCVRTGDRARRAAVTAGEQTAGLVGRGLTRVRDDRHWASDVIAGAALGGWVARKVDTFAQLGAQVELGRRRLPWIARRGYAPPAIAGMTMTSLPSGTGASMPPFVRASSSPM